jgi:hexulose-6-phosphate isomerase
MQGRLSKPRSSSIQEFPWEDWTNEFALAARCSLNCIEWTVDLNKLETNPIFDPLYKEFIHQITESNGITIESITLDNFVEAPLHKVNAKNNLKSDIKKLEWIVDRIKVHSIKTLVLPIVKENGEENEETLANLCQILVGTQSILEANNIFLALELELRIDQISNVVKSLAEYKNIGFNFDIGNSASLGNDPIREIQLYGNKLFNVHIKDRSYKGSTVPLGAGDARFKLIFQELNRNKYNGNFILQAARIPNQPEIETIKNYLHFCKNAGLWILH